ncbi:Cof-type HAD-IIB family hydrolase [Rummeliibacillus pycnus]|uniref:Cof-type HAD-IIB family hydrolase n=1 Tax=Rummeliibacillus pycnus TaxID=101070 RepID=UPI0037C747C7
MSLIAIDLDGTLLNHQNEISKENLSAIKHAQENGIEVVISTGRAYFDVKNICKKAGLSTYVIGTNGATIHSNDDKRIDVTTIDKNKVLSILQWLDEREYYYEVFTDKAIYALKKHRDHFHNEIQILKNSILDKEMKEIVDVAERQFDQFGYVLVENYQDILKKDENFYNILACSFDQKKLIEAQEHIQSIDNLMVVSSADHNIEITNNNATKGIALEKLATLLNRSLNRSMAIGDSNNDLSMFKKVGYSIAMGNAKDEIKEICTATTLTNDKNGVAHAIYLYLENIVLQK